MASGSADKWAVEWARRMAEIVKPSRYEWRTVAHHFQHLVKVETGEIVATVTQHYAASTSSALPGRRFATVRGARQATLRALNITMEADDA